MFNSKLIEWVLRIAVAGEFIGHGTLALQGKQAWIGWMEKLFGATPEIAAQVVFFIGLLDVFVALVVLFRPIKIVLLWAVFWGFATALVRPIVGESFWDFIERFANWGAPLALLLLLGWPKTGKEWLK